MADRQHLLFHFLHLLGVGHVHRARQLVEAFHKEGIEVDIVYGGVPLDGVEFAARHVHYLPPIRAEDATYKRMLDKNGEAISQPYLEKRQEMLLDIFYRLSPDAVLTEAFPFGRRVVRHEINALLSASKQLEHPPLIVSSVRDILQERRKRGRVEEACALVRNWFDHVMVHADPNIIRLNESFPMACEIEDKLSYTGFVVPPPKENRPDNRYDVIVSAGGGGFGGDMLSTALQLANDDYSRNWCLATGPNLDPRTVQKLRNNAAPHVAVVERLENLAEHLKRAGMSISQCGYNTAMDVLAAHESSQCRAVFVPHDTTGQTEQLRRATLLEKAGYAITVPQSKLTTTTLQSAMRRAAELPRVERFVDFNGAANSARLLRNWMEQRR